MNPNVERYILWTCYLGITILVCVHINSIFFWDSIQFGSKHAHWFYEQNFRHLLLPDSIDSGHPPGFGMYIAAIWKIFGKTLPVSHLAMLPFVYLSLYWSHAIGNSLTNSKYAVLFPVILLANTMYLGHAILISPDVMLVAFFLGLYYATISKNQVLKSIVILLMACISLRGMMLAFAFYIYEIYILFKARKWTLASLFKTALPYLPGGVLALSYLLFHFYSKSWFVYHDASPWSGSFKIVEFKGLLRNGFVLLWRFLDFGFVFVWMGIYYLFKTGNKKSQQDFKDLISLIIILFVVTALPLIMYQALIGHRYLLPIYVLLSFILILQLFRAELSKLKKRIIILFIIIGMVSGNFWVYPNTISQGWDVTLAHTPYYKLRSNLLTYLHQVEIPEEMVGTKFPAKSEDKYLYLTDDTGGFKDADLKSDQFILYSNIFNEFTDAEYVELAREWDLIYAEQIRLVYFKLFKRK